MYYVVPAGIDGGQIRVTQQAVSDFRARWDASCGGRGERYGISMVVEWDGRRLPVRCVYATSRRMIMETDPLGPDLQMRHYFALCEGADGWRPSERVIVIADRSDCTPAQRGVIANRELFGS